MEPMSVLIMALLMNGTNLTPATIIEMNSQSEYVPCVGNAKHFTNDGTSPCYDCWHFSVDLVRELRMVGIESAVILVQKPVWVRHYIVAANINESWHFIEPQTGEQADMTTWHFRGVEDKNYTLRKKVAAAAKKR